MVDGVSGTGRKFRIQQGFHGVDDAGSCVKTGGGVLAVCCKRPDGIHGENLLLFHGRGRTACRQGEYQGYAKDECSGAFEAR